MGETKDGFQPAVFQDRIKLELRRKAGVLGVGWGGGRLLGVFLFSPASADPRKAPTSLRMDRGRGRPRGDGEWTWLLSPKLATGPDHQVSSSYWGNTGRSALCTPVVSFFSKSCTMPILTSVVLQLTPSNLTGEGKGQRLLCSHTKSHFSVPFWGFRLQGCLDSRTGWEEGEKGRGGGEALCGFCLRGKSQRSKGREAAALQRAQRP